MILYDYCRSSAAFRVRIALNLKGISYEQIPVNLVTGEQRLDDHLTKNSQGLVPVLKDGDVLISQSLAICEYLDEAYPDTLQLVRGTAAEKAAQRSFAQAIACDIHPINNLRVLKYLVGEMGVDEAKKMQWYHHWIHTTFEALEAKLQQSSTPFCLGDQPGIADVCLVPQVFNANRFELDMSSYPRIREITKYCEGQDAFANAHPSLQPGA